MFFVSLNEYALRESSITVQPLNKDILQQGRRGTPRVIPHDAIMIRSEVYDFNLG